MRRSSKGVLATAGAVSLLSGLATVPVSAAVAAPSAQHVLVLSVDGMHQQDLAWYATHYPNSAIASLVRGGTEYTAAQTPFPSDSFPGTVAIFSGGNPTSTGVYYDDTFNHRLLPAGTTSCSTTAPGAEVAYTEAADINQSSLDAGQGIPGLASNPNLILQMTPHPRTLLNPAALPVNPTNCAPVYPDAYLKVNTVFSVIHAAGMRTAYSDKHPAYEILGGPGGSAIDDLFTPEINSQAIGFPAGTDWTQDNAATQEYDGFKVQAVLNEIDGYDHSGTHKVGTPAVLGMNFQTVSTAQKLPFSDGLKGGYLPGGTEPGPLLVRALNFINTSVQSMLNHIAADGLASSTTVVLTAKHGQSPTDPSTLTRVPDSPIIDGINAAWAAAHPTAAPLVAFSTDDDVMQLWLSDRSVAAENFVQQYLLSHPAAGNTVTGSARTLPQSGLSEVFAGAQAAEFYGVAVNDPRHPDVVGIVQHGVVYTGGMAKIAEHGGDDPQDRSVPLVVAGGGVPAGTVSNVPVETAQIAPTILQLLNLDPNALQAVQQEHTQVLPGA